ncbi:unnamed protein product [Discosporangium mesarthrocarpum]
MATLGTHPVRPFFYVFVMPFSYRRTSLPLPTGILSIGMALASSHLASVRPVLGRVAQTFAQPPSLCYGRLQRPSNVNLSWGQDSTGFSFLTTLRFGVATYPGITATGRSAVKMGFLRDDNSKLDGVKISPSSVSTFKQCPKLYEYRYIQNLPTTSTPAQVGGILVHEVLSKYFTLPNESRNIGGLREVFKDLLKTLIAREKEEPQFQYADFFANREEEAAWAVGCLEILANFLIFESEDTCNELKGLEMRLSPAMLPGATPTDRDNIELSADAGLKWMNVTGIIDRLDRGEHGKLRVLDYKTGKVPDLKYSQAANRRIMEEKFFQLKVYALLVEAVLGEVPGELVIVYLSGPDSFSRAVSPRDLREVEQELATWSSQILLAQTSGIFEPKPGRLCDWCSFKSICPAFPPAKGQSTS